jgi:CheY-like chemotaxis protein
MHLVTEHTKVLIVEDNVAYANLLKLAWELSDLGSEIEIACNGQEAINYLSRSSGSPGDRDRSLSAPSIVLTDINMPYVSGLELLAWIRQTSHLKDLPVIVMSSYVEPLQLKILNSLGVTYYFDKPLTLKELLSELSQAGQKIQGSEFSWDNPRPVLEVTTKCSSKSLAK